ncbi:MAG: hypothetical protein HY566_01910 [Candidatus Kerfeldbacteria bacterium]|nr:hypothetical protein [Candidatus Kerfeldbacteria bacterium]
MEFRSTLYDLRRFRAFFAAFVVVVTVAAAALSMTRQPTFVASLSIAVNRIHRQETAAYQYDGYYAIQASDLFTQTILSWFLTPSVLLEVYERAGVEPHISSLSELVGRFRARKFSPQNLVVQFAEPDRSNAEKISAAIADVMKERTSLTNQDDKGDPIFEAVPAKPVIVESKPNIALNTVAGFLASIIVGFVLIAAARSLRT